MKKPAFLIIILCLVLPLQGCIAFMASQLGYIEADAKYTKLYNGYKTEQANADQPVKEYRDWLKDQPLKSSEIKVFKNNGVISPEEAKSIRQRERLRNPNAD